MQTAAILGDHAAVSRFLEADPHSATAKAAPRDWEPLTYLCFSRYLRLDAARSGNFVRTATALLDAGADANTGFFEPSHLPGPEFESVLYGAAGIAHHPELTLLLIERGADPNNGEVVYHTPETYDNRAMRVLVESGKLTADSLATLLLRKHDWHDFEGVRYLLEHGADPNRMTHWGRTSLCHAIQRDNHLTIIALSLDHFADGCSVAALAARRGRGDVLDLFQQRGIPIELNGIDRLLAGCATDDTAAIQSIKSAGPELLLQLRVDGGTLLSEFAGNGNAAGVRNLLDLGADIQSLCREGDGYFGIAKNSMALHVAAWRARHDTVRLLIERGAPVNVIDGAGTPLALAIRACTDSYWMNRRSTESIAALLNAGASKAGIILPTGYPEADILLR